MKRIGKALSYSNVVATIALFLALGGGVVYAASNLGKNAVKSKNIAANAVKSRNLAKRAVKTKSLAANSVTSGKLRKGAVHRSDMAVGTLAGLEVAEVTAVSVPGLNVEPPSGAPSVGTPIPLTGDPTFTPVAGKAYELLVELRGNPVDVDGSGDDFCNPSVSLFVNGAQLSGVSILQDVTGASPFNNDPVGTSSTAIALQAAGEPQTLSALSRGRSGCSSATTASLRAVVIELG